MLVVYIWHSPADCDLCRFHSFLLTRRDLIQAPPPKPTVLKRPSCTIVCNIVERLQQTQHFTAKGHADGALMQQQQQQQHYAGNKMS
jgi:hypothetical protein